MQDLMILEDLRHNHAALAAGRSAAHQVTIYSRAIDTIVELLTSRRELRDLAADALAMAELGDYSDGNEEFGLDEGTVKACRKLADLAIRAKQLGLVKREVDDE